MRSGSDVAIAAAQHAATGAKTCIISAIRTIGRYFCKRRRINEHIRPIDDTNHCIAGKSRSVPPQMSDKTPEMAKFFRRVRGITALRKDFCPFQGMGTSLLYYLHVNRCMQIQFEMDNFHSFPNLH